MRLPSLNDFRINVKAELEIEHLHAKIDEMREQEILKRVHTIERLSERLAEAEANRRAREG